MKKIILHIGHPKTGSSYLQSMLSLNDSLLNRYNIKYPKTSNAPKILGVKGYVSNGNGGVFCDRKSGNKITKMLSIANNCSEDNILFSSELFFKALTRTDVEAILANSNLQVILYTRNTIEHKISQWQQAVKGAGCTKDANEKLMDAPLSVYPTVIEWIKLAAKFKFDLKLRNYSNMRNQVIEKFMQDITNRSTSIEGLINPPNKTVNRSLTYPETEIIRFINCYRTQNTPKRKYSDFLVNNYPEFEAYKPKINIETYHKIAEVNSPLIAELNYYMPADDQVSIGDQNQFCGIGNDESITQIPSKVLKSLADAIPIIIDNDYIYKNASKATRLKKNLRNLALSLEDGKPLATDDALTLIKIAQHLNPESPKLKQKAREWETKN